MKQETSSLSNNENLKQLGNNNNHNENKHFIEDELFQKIIAIREEIYEATEINVSPRKIVNLLLNKSDLKALCQELIQRYS